jgi:hypothetical protein
VFVQVAADQDRRTSTEAIDLFVFRPIFLSSPYTFHQDGRSPSLAR